jgi:pyruvate dehydrogenase E2 component (dihydrolipoamide acetyltransferase)
MDRNAPRIHLNSTSLSHFTSQDEYVLAKVLEAAKGREVKVGEPVALSVEDAAGYEAFAELDKVGKIEIPGAAAPAPTPTAGPSSSSSSSSPAAAAAPPTPPSTTASAPPSGAAIAHLGPYALSPAARHLLESRSLELFKDVQGTGKGGRVTKGDVIHAIANGQVATKVRAAPAPNPAPAPAPAAPKAAAAAAAAPTAAAAATAAMPPSAPVSATIPEIVAAPGSFVDTKNSNMRKVIARRLAESKASVPHSYETVECGAWRVACVCVCVCVACVWRVCVALVSLD